MNDLSMKKSGTLAILVIVLFVSIGLQTSGVSDPGRSISSAYQIWKDTASIRCIAVGDVDQNHPGDEIVLGDDLHRVMMIFREGNRWNVITLLESPWFIHSIGIADLDTTNPGNEIAVLAMGPDGLQMLEDNNGNWENPISTVICSPPAQCWDFRVGDFDAFHPGDEACGSWEIIMDCADVFIYSFDGLQWTSTHAYQGMMPVMSVDVGDFNSTHPGNEIFMVDEDTEHLQLLQNEEGWNYSVLWWGMYQHSGREAVIGDVDSLHPGNEVVIRERMDPRIHLLKEDNGRWTPTWIIGGRFLYTDVIICDISDTHIGNEVVTTSDKNVTMIWGMGQQWFNKILWRNNQLLTCIAYGEFDATSPGHELAVADESGSLKRIPFSH
ncbi:MAG: hypothetical protein V1726_08760 [Methanobacteriota archaeon]